MSTKNLSELQVYTTGTEVRRAFDTLARQLPHVEQFALRKQIIRASRSITANIAEGYGRYHYQENIQYCRMSRGSLYELSDHLLVALDSQYISQDQYDNYIQLIENNIKLLNGYINYLKKQKTAQK